MTVAEVLKAPAPVMAANPTPPPAAAPPPTTPAPKIETAKKAKRPRKAKAASEAEPLVVPEPIEIPIPVDAPVEIRLLHERLAEVRAMVRASKADVEAHRAGPSTFRGLVEAEIRLTRELIGMTPPTPPDPKDDPMNVNAREFLRAGVRDLIENAELRRGALCPRCMAEVAPK